MDMGKISIADVLKMSPAERILFVEDVWDSLAANPDSVLLPDSHREELDRRLEAYHQDPDAGSPWAEVRDRIRQAS
jgi:putative addiction module component (TIGR02574 family)